MIFYAIDFRLRIEDSFTHEGRFGVALPAPDASAAEKQAKSRAAHEARELYPLARQIEVTVLQVTEIPEPEYVAAAFGLITDLR